MGGLPVLTLLLQQQLLLSWLVVPLRCQIVHWHVDRLQGSFVARC